MVAALGLLVLTFTSGVSPASGALHSKSMAYGVNLGPSNPFRIAVARSRARELLALAWFPTGSREFGSWVRLNGHEYTEGVDRLGSPDVVDIARYYLSGPMNQGLSWLNGHVPKGARLNGRGGTNRGHLQWSYSFPAVLFLSYSDLQYTKLILPNGAVELRIDAQIQWTPQKSVYSIVGVGADKLTAAFMPGESQLLSSKTSIVTNDTATISTFRNEVNALPVAYPGVMSCPFESAGSVTLEFYRAGETFPFAAVSTGAGGCGNIRVSQYSIGGQLIGSGSDGGGYNLMPAAEKLLGITSQQ